VQKAGLVCEEEILGPIHDEREGGVMRDSRVVWVGCIMLMLRQYMSFMTVPWTMI
jgi:hypothetical protein